MSAADERLRRADFDAATEILRMLTIDCVEPVGDRSTPRADRGAGDVRGTTADR